MPNPDTLPDLPTGSGYTLHGRPFPVILIPRDDPRCAKGRTLPRISL